MLRLTIFIGTVIFIFNIQQIEGLRRCYQCRSRGELGSCKDPFRFNITQIDDEPGVTAVPCASGWCGKVIESAGTLKDDDYDMPTQRMCVQRGPSDAEDRCAHTIYNYKKVYMCFCQGDLCNSSPSLFKSDVNRMALIVVAAIPMLLVALWRR